MKLNIFGIIPARGKSRGLPGKNIKPLLGKPLMAWTIEAAKRTKYLNKVVVSTEDKEIAEIARKCRAEVIERVEELAKDETPTINVIFHALEVLKVQGYNPNIIVLLQPTSPLRIAEDIDNAIELFMDKDCESVVSVYESEQSVYWSFKIEDNYLKPIFDEKYLNMRRQELPKVYMPNGAIFISTPQTLYKYKSFYCPKTIPYIMHPEKSVDIDKELDFMLAELVMKKYGFASK